MDCGPGPHEHESMITCKECTDFLVDYLDGELEEATEKAFERHLKLCPPCVGYLESYKKTIALGRRVIPTLGTEPTPETETTEPAPALPAELIRAILSATQPSDDSPSANT